MDPSRTKGTKQARERPEASADLRQRAEAIARENSAESPKNLNVQPREAMRRGLQDLRVDQIRLEMQNMKLRRGQEELDVSESRYSDLYDFAPVGYCLVSDSGLILEANLTAATLLGLARDTLVKQPISRYIHREDRDIYVLCRKRLIETDEPLACDLRMVKNDGTQFWAHIMATVAPDADDATALRVMLSDVSERKRAQEALDKFFDQPMNLHLIATLDGVIRRVNRGWEVILGYRPAELEGTLFLELIHPDDIDATKAEMSKLAQGISTFHFENRYRHKNGGFRLLAWSASISVLDQTIYAVASDITERKQAEAEVRKLFLAVEHSPASIVITDRAANIEYVNPRFEEITGYTKMEVLGGNPRMLQSGKTSLETYREMWRTISGGGEWRGELCNRRKDGELFWEHVAISGLKDENGEIAHYIGVKENITKLKQNEEELRQAVNAAKQASRAKSTFLANMSHEIRTPLHNIIGLAQLSRRDATNLKQRGRLDDLCSSSEHLLSVITNVLDISKIEADQLVLEQRGFSLGRVLNRLTSVVAASAREKGVNFTLDVTPSLHDTKLRGDALRLGQVLINLVANAIKFSEHGSVAVSITCLNEDATGLRLRFSVKDTGIGIAPEDIPRLFVAFEQGDKTINRKFGGSGLGLTISDRLVRAMGGVINVESRPGAGSNFSFEILLPRGSPLDGEEDEDDSSDATRSVKFADSRILVAEDHPLSRVLMREMLSEFGCKVDLAKDGPEAVEYARAHAYDLILMDMQMPTLDGLAATRAIRQLPGYQHTPILAVTANAFVEDREQCAQAGMNGHISKPLTPALLAHVLSHWLAESSASDSGCEAKDDLSNVDAGPAAGLDSRAILGGAIGRGLTREFILGEFLKLHRNDLAQVRAHLAAGDPESARKLVHTLEGAAAMVGARKLRAAVAELSAALRASTGKAAIESSLAACEAEISQFAEGA